LVDERVAGTLLASNRLVHDDVRKKKTKDLET